MFFRQFDRLVMAVAFTAALAASQTTTTTTTETVTLNTPPVGLASSETAQINLVNTASNEWFAASCTGTVTFLNSSGTVIGSATPFTVASGIIQSVSLPFAKSGGTGTRTEIRATISQTITDQPLCNLQVTLETYDTSTGVTHVFLANRAGNVGEVGVRSLPPARVQSHQVNR